MAKRREPGGTSPRLQNEHDCQRSNRRSPIVAQSTDRASGANGEPRVALEKRTCHPPGSPLIRDILLTEGETK